MNLAYDLGIDAFALNFAYKDASNIPTLQKAFNATQGMDFKVFFSFDYASGSPWLM